MVNCSRPECQTTAGCTCDNRLYEYERLRSEVAALKAENERLTAALAESDRNAEKLEALLDPHVAWEGQPPKGCLAAAERALAERAGGVKVGEWKRDFEAWIKERPNHVSLYEAYHAGRSALTHPAPTHNDGSGEAVCEHDWEKTREDLCMFVCSKCRQAYSGNVISDKPDGWTGKYQRTALTHTSGEVTEVMVHRALASLAKEIEMTAPMRSPMYRALEAALRGIMSAIQWHKLIDGDPPATGRYIVAHRGMAMLAIYRVPQDLPPGSGTKGWNSDVSAFTHWAKEPHAPDDGTPQLFRPEGRLLRSQADEAASWAAIASGGKQ